MPHCGGCCVVGHEHSGDCEGLLGGLEVMTASNRLITY